MLYPESQSEELSDAGTESSEDLGSETAESSTETQGAGESSEDTNSTEGIDKSKLTPEVKAYLDKREKEMLSDYTRKTQEIAEERRQYEARQRDLDDKLIKVAEMQSSPKKDSLIDELKSNMNASQQQSFDKLLKAIREDRNAELSKKEKAIQSEMLALRAQQAELLKQQFMRDNPRAKALWPKMEQIYKDKGGVNSHLTLDDVYLLAQGESGLKKEGVDEYRKTVKTKKEAVTTKPGSVAGKQSGVEYKRGKRYIAENVLKAFNASKEALGAK